jgi:uncharacterized protein
MSQEKLAEILTSLRAALAGLLGARLAAVYLYGSQARGDARPDSDIDVLIVLRGEFNYFEMVDQVSYITSALSLQHEVVISCTFVSQDELDNLQTPFLVNVRREAIVV